MMPLKGLLSRPDTGPLYRVEDALEQVDADQEPGPARTESWKRLSLKLSTSNGGPFQPFLTHEPEHPTVAPVEPEADARSLDDELSNMAPNRANVPAAFERERVDLQNGPPSVEMDLEPLVRPQRFSLLRFRHASDPQLSSRYKKDSPTPLAGEVARE